MIPFPGWDMFLGPGLEQGGVNSQRQHPMSCQLGWSQAAQPEPGFQVTSMGNEAKMPNPAGQGLGTASAQMVRSGWEEVDPSVLPYVQEAVGFLLSSHGQQMKVFWNSKVAKVGKERQMHRNNGSAVGSM